MTVSTKTHHPTPFATDELREFVRLGSDRDDDGLVKRTEVDRQHRISVERFVEVVLCQMSGPDRRDPRATPGTCRELSRMSIVTMRACGRGLTRRTRPNSIPGPVIDVRPNNAACTPLTLLHGLSTAGSSSVANGVGWWVFVLTVIVFAPRGGLHVAHTKPF